MKSIKTYSQQIERLKAALETADTVVIGAGAGLSTSAGFVYTGERFERYFQTSPKNMGSKICTLAAFSPMAPRRSIGPIGAAISLSIGIWPRPSRSIRTCWSWQRTKTILC